MGCFIACFCSSNSKNSKSKKSTTYPHQNFSKKYETAKSTEAAEIQDSIKSIFEWKKSTCNLTTSPNQNLFKRHEKCEPARHAEPTEAANIQDSISESKKSNTDSSFISQDQDFFKRHEKIEPAQNAKPTEEAILQDSIKPISESRDNGGVAFDMNVETSQKVKTNEVARVGFDLNVETSEKVKTNAVANSVGSTVNEENENKKGAKEENQNQSQSLSDSRDSSMMSYPPMHRYHGCTSSDDDNPEMGLFEVDSIGVDKLLIQEEESSESLFSLSIESRKQVNCVEVGDDKEVTSPLKAHDSSEREMKSVDSTKQIQRAEFHDTEVKTTRNIFGLPDKEIKSNALNPNPRDITQSVRSVLNPIENLSQWKLVKARTGSPLSYYDEKENINQEQELKIPKSEETSFKKLAHNSNRSADIMMRKEDKGIAVDTSLSSWLVESEKTPISKDSPSSIGNSSLERVNSWRSVEDRPILGALSIEEIIQFSAPSSPRRSPNRNPDEMPIIGSVGSYWSLTGQAMDSSNSGSSRKGRLGRSRTCSEDKKAADFHGTTPLRKRFERALDRGTA